MAKKKSNYLILAGVLFLGGLVFGGCGAFNWFNPDFLNQYQPLGQTSLSTLQAKGPVTLVLENLTEESKHQENALFTVNYIDAQGNTQTLTPRTPLNAVAPDKRDPSKANFDPSYRQVYILDCGVREIWFSATVYRTTIVSTTTTLILGNQQSVEITYCAAMVTKTGTPPDVKLTTNQFSAFTALQAPPSHLKELEHFQCGDVILAGILDARAKNNTIIPMPLDCDYTDVDSLSQTVPPTTSNLIFNPSHSLLLAEYNYPIGYLIIPLALPNMLGVETALPTLQLIAADWAGKDLTTTKATGSQAKTPAKTK